MASLKRAGLKNVKEFDQGRGFNKESKDQHYYAMVIKATILTPELLNRCAN